MPIACGSCDETITSPVPKFVMTTHRGAAKLLPPICRQSCQRARTFRPGEQCRSSSGSIVVKDPVVSFLEIEQGPLDFLNTKAQPYLMVRSSAPPPQNTTLKPPSTASVWPVT